MVNSMFALNAQCLDNNLHVTLVWVPANVGLVENEVVDWLAKGGLSHVALDDDVGYAPTEFQAISRRHVLGEWRYGMLPAKPHIFYTRNSVSLNPEPYSTYHRVERCITRLRLGTSLLSGSHGIYIIGSIWVVLCAEPLVTPRTFCYTALPMDNRGPTSGPPWLDKVWYCLLTFSTTAGRLGGRSF